MAGWCLSDLPALATPAFLIVLSSVLLPPGLEWGFLCLGLQNL